MKKRLSHTITCFFKVRKALAAILIMTFRFVNAEPWGLFLKAAKSYLILSNGSVALKYVLGQPQRTISIKTDASSACPGAFIQSHGGVRQAV